MTVDKHAPKNKVGFDIGGTKTEIVLLNSQNEIVFKLREPTERDKGYPHILSVLKKLFFACLENQKLKTSDIASIGLALPGTVNPQTEVMEIGNTRILEGKDIKKDLLNTLNIDIPIWGENDANCFALAECHMGAGKNLGQNMVGIILGTGVGGGVILNGKIYSGRRGSAGEIGHTFLKKQNLKCYCDQEDCTELFLNGEGFKKSGLKTYKEDLGLFLGRLTNILDPDYFVLGGGVSQVDDLYVGIEELILPHLFYKKNPPKVLKHKISDSAGGIGAALLHTFKSLD